MCSTTDDPLFPPKKSPWKNIGEPSATIDVGCGLPDDSGHTPISLSDIMSEELVSEMNKQEQGLQTTLDTQQHPSHGEEKIQLPDIIMSAGPSTEGGEECSDDFLLARLLQHEFDREHDQVLRRKQAAVNKNDKVAISFEKYMYTHPVEDSDSSDEDEDLRELITNKICNKRNPDFGASGMVRDGDGKLVTKHDKIVTANKNAAKFLQFPPDFPTGDAIDMKIDNRTYNILKKHSESEQKRHQRVKDKEEKATAEMSMDARTRLLLFKMINSGLLESVGGAIATGKESVVFHAYGGSGEEAVDSEDEQGESKKEKHACFSPPKKPIPKECAVKVYKTVLNEFKNRAFYVKDDYRFKNPRKVLRIWAEKEFHNLNRMNRCGLRCPSVVKLKKHILVLSFIGKDGKAAPQLRFVKFESDEQTMSAFVDCVQFMTRMYRECQLVHADLSEYNILYMDGECWFIDVAQTVDCSHPNALNYLARDCGQVIGFFRKQSQTELPTARELFNEITGIDIQSEEKFIIEVQEFANENRTVQMKNDKKKPADCMLRKYNEENNSESQHESPVKDYV